MYGIAAIMFAFAAMLWGAAQVITALGLHTASKPQELTEEQKDLIRSEAEMNRRYTEGLNNIMGLSGGGFM